MGYDDVGDVGFGSCVISEGGVREGGMGESGNQILFELELMNGAAYLIVFEKVGRGFTFEGGESKRPTLGECGLGGLHDGCVDENEGHVGSGLVGFLVELFGAVVKDEIADVTLAGIQRTLESGLGSNERFGSRDAYE